MISENSVNRFKLAFFIAMYGTKLLLFIIVKGKNSRELKNSLKERLKRAAPVCMRIRHSALNTEQKIPSQKPIDVLRWLKSIWQEFPVGIVKNSFTGSGYYLEDGIDYSG